MRFKSSRQQQQPITSASGSHRDMAPLGPDPCQIIKTGMVGMRRRSRRTRHSYHAPSKRRQAARDSLERQHRLAQLCAAGHVAVAHVDLEDLEFCVVFVIVCCVLCW